MKKNNRLILAIETSCDETSVALLQGRDNVVTSKVSSQVEIHAEYGGVVPEIAARKHLELINPLIEEVFLESGLDFNDVDAVATTIGPGLVIALLVGVSAAKSAAYALSVPFIGVNHLEGHIYANFLDNPELKPPFLALVVSGGHTLLAIMKEHGKYETLGETLDDAVGEALDKAAAFLGLGYPGGPVIDKLAKEGDPGAYNLPRALINRDDFMFSLSGVKTALINLVRKEEDSGRVINIPDLCASFQAAIFDVLEAKTLKALKLHKLDRLVLAGGVAANSELRKIFEKAALENGFKFSVPQLKYCTDNAVMIAVAAHYRMLMGQTTPLETEVYATLKLPS